MTIQTKQRITQKTSHIKQERLSEVAEILLRGIYRLEERKRAENLQIILASKSSPSLHSTDSTVINKQDYSHYE